MNVDGAYTAGQNNAGCGGVIRDQSARWVVGFTSKLGFCSVLEADM